MTLIPKYQQPALDGSGLFTLPWRRWLEAVNTALNSAGSDNLSLAAEVAAIATALGSPDGTVANIPDQSRLDAVIYSDNGIQITGTLASGKVGVLWRGGIANLSDVDLSSLADTNVLKWNAASETWLPGPITEANLSFSDIPTANASTSKHGLLKKLPGNSSVYMDGNGNYTSPSATGGAGWQTAVDLDFSAQASQTLTADGAYTIGGLTWTKASSTNDNVAMAVTNGTGLVIQPKSTGQYFGLTRTAPYLYLDLVSAIPAYYLEMPLRVWVYVSADNITASGDVVGFAIENMSTVGTTACVYIMRRANNGGTKSIEFTGAIGATVATITAVAANLDNTDRVMCFSQPTGRVSGSAVLWYGADASGWPSVAALRPSQRNAAVTSTFTPSQDMVTGLPMKLVLFAQRNGSATALSVTIKRVRIDFQTT